MDDVKKAQLTELYIKHSDTYLHGLYFYLFQKHFSFNFYLFDILTLKNI